jgi:phosphoglycolate phosphatase
VPVIAVDYGYTETPVGELGPDRVIGALRDLPPAVFELLGPKYHSRPETP